MTLPAWKKPSRYPLGVSTMSSLKPIKPNADAMRKPALRFLLLLAMIATIVVAPYLRRVSFFGFSFGAIVTVAFFALVLCLVAVRLVDCIRMAWGTEYMRKLNVITALFVCTAIMAMAHIDEIQSENPSYSELTMIALLYTPLWYLLELAKVLLARPGAILSSDKRPDTAD